MGGHPPSTSPLASVSPPPDRGGAMGPWGQPPKIPGWLPTHEDLELYCLVAPRQSRATPPDAPPRSWEYRLVARLPVFTNLFQTFLGDYSRSLQSSVPILPIFQNSQYQSFIHVTTFHTTTVFFSDDVLRRNQIIKEVVLVEASSILPLPR